MPPMPEFLDELEGWAYMRLLGSVAGGRRQLFYKTVGDGLTPVTLVLYGCIREVNLAALGNWTG